MRCLVISAAFSEAQGNVIQREPRYGAPSSEKTEFRILYDERALYIGVWVWDSDPSGIMGTEMKRACCSARTRRQIAIARDQDDILARR